MDHRAGHVVLGEVEEVEGLLIPTRHVDFLAVGDMICSLVVHDGRVGAAQGDVTLVLFCCPNLMVFGFGPLRKGQLQIGLDTKLLKRLIQRLPQGAGAVLPHLSGGEVHGAQAAVVHHEDVLAGEADLAVGGLVAVVVGFVLVDAGVFTVVVTNVNWLTAIFIARRLAVAAISKRRERHLFTVNIGFQDVDFI